MGQFNHEYVPSPDGPAMIPSVHLFSCGSLFWSEFFVVVC